MKSLEDNSPENRTSVAGAVTAVAITIVLWASAFPAIRAALTSFSPSELAFARFVIASLVIGVYWIFIRFPLPSRKHMPRVILAGLLGIAFYNLLLNFGELTVTAGAASFIVNLSPVFGLILGVCLAGERVSLWGVLGTLVSFVGVTIIAVGDLREMRFDPGTILVVGAAFCFALSFVVQRPLLAHIKPIGVTSGMIWTATAALSPFAPSAFVALGNASAEAVIALVFLGIGPSMVAYLAWSHALTRYPVSRATSFLYLAPPVAVIVSLFWIGEVPSLQTIIGGGVMLAGVIVVNTLGRARSP